MARISAGAKHSGKQLGRDRLAAEPTGQHQQHKERDARARAQQLRRQSKEKCASEPVQQTAQQQQEGKPQQAQGRVGALAGPAIEAEPPQGLHEGKVVAEPPVGQQAQAARGRHAEHKQRSGATTAAESRVAQAAGRKAMLQSQGAAEKEQAAHAQQQQQQLPPSMVLKGSLLQNRLSGLTDAQSQQAPAQAGTAEHLKAQDQAQKPVGLPAEPATAQHQQLLPWASPTEQLQVQALAQLLSQNERQNSALQSQWQAAESPAAWLVARQPQGAEPGGLWAPQQHQGLQPGTQWAQQLGLANGHVQQPQLALHHQQQLLLLAQLQAQLACGASGGSFMSPVSAQGNQTALAAALAAVRSQGRQTLPSVVLAAPSQPLAEPTAGALHAAQASPLAPGPRLAEQGQCGMPPQAPLAEPQPPHSKADAAASAAPAALGSDNFDWATWMHPEGLVGGIAGRIKRQASRRQLQSQQEQAAPAADPDFTFPTEESGPGRQRRRPAAQHSVQRSEQPPSKGKRARSSGQQPLRQGKRRKAPPWEKVSEDVMAAAGPGSAAEGQFLPAAARSRRGAVRGQQAQRPRRGAKPSKGWGRRQQQGSLSSHEGSPAAGSSSADPEISEAEGPHLPSQALGKSRLSNVSAGVRASQQPAARLTRRASQEAVLNE